MMKIFLSLYLFIYNNNNKLIIIIIKEELIVILFTHFRPELTSPENIRQIPFVRASGTGIFIESILFYIILIYCLY